MGDEARNIYVLTIDDDVVLAVQLYLSEAKGWIDDLRQQYGRRARVQVLGGVLTSLGQAQQSLRDQEANWA